MLKRVDIVKNGNDTGQGRDKFGSSKSRMEDIPTQVLLPNKGLMLQVKPMEVVKGLKNRFKDLRPH